jgi:site-specific recombinase XerD
VMSLLRVVIKMWLHYKKLVNEKKPTVIYEKTKNIDAVRRLLGHSSVTATSSYIGVTDNSAMDLARQFSF